MNALWWLTRKLYMLGLVPVIPVFLIAINEPESNYEVTRLVICVSLLYVALGVILLFAIPRRLRGSLLNRVERYKKEGFRPRWEAVSLIFNRYLGFDAKSQRVLYVDVNDDTEKFVEFHDVTEWELDDDNRRTSLLKLLTRIPELPVIGVRIDRRMRDVCRAQLNTIFS